MTRLTTLFLFALLSFTLPVGCGDDDDSERTDAGCCTSDSQCGDRRCIGGACLEVPADQCFEDTDCTGDATCRGATICPCGAQCVAPTKAGTCEAAACPATVSGAGQSCPKDGVRCDYAGDDGCPVTLVCATDLSTSRWDSVGPATGDSCASEGKVCTYREEHGGSATLIRRATCGNSLWSVTEGPECGSSQCGVGCECPAGTTCQATAGQSTPTCQ